MPPTMNPRQAMKKRKRGRSESAGEFSHGADYGSAHLVPPTGNVHDISNLIPTTKSQDNNLSTRPRRSTANYGHFRTSPLPPKAKRAHTEPMNQRLGQEALPGHTLASPLQHTSSAYRAPAQANLPQDVSAQTNPQVQGLISGQTPLDDLHLEDRNNFLSMIDITRRFAGRLLRTSPAIFGRAGMAVSIIQLWRNSNEDTASPAMTGNEQLVTPVEPLRSSSIDHDMNLDSDTVDKYGDEETPESEIESSQSGSDFGKMPSTTAREPSPPPRHGYPRANETYKENVLPHDAIRRDDSAIVWNAKDHICSARVLWDCGTNPNFIATAKAKSLGFSPIPLHEEDYQIYGTLAGSEDLATHYIIIDLAIDSVGLKRHRVYFLCVDTSEVEMILGYKYIGEHKIFEKLVRKKLSTPEKAFTIFTKKPSKEEIQRMLKDKENRRKKAELVEASIQAQLSAKGNSQAGSTNSAEAMGIRTTVEINSSMAKHQENSFLPRRSPSVAGSSTASSAGGLFLRGSFDSSHSNGGIFISPATTFSSQSMASSSSVVHSSIGCLPEKIGHSLDMLKHNGRKETGDTKR